MAHRNRFGTALAVAIAVVIGSTIALITTVLLNMFVLDKYDSYGKVDIPGRTSVQLPAGTTTINFSSFNGGNGSLPVPDLSIKIIAPPGVAKPQLHETIGLTTSVDGYAHRRLWVLHIVHPGTYQIRTRGNINGYIQPQLAFGYSTPYGSLSWWFGALAAVASVCAVAILIVRSRHRSPIAHAFLSHHPYPPYEASTASADNAVRIEQLQTLAGLRDTGALSDDEFESEKRRVLSNG